MQLEQGQDNLRKETLSAWAEFQATGLHVTAEEVEKWLASWGTDNELPAPTLIAAGPPRCD